MNEPTLTRVVQVNNDKGQSKIFKPGDKVPPAWGRLIRNAKAWGGVVPDWDAIEKAAKRKPRKSATKRKPRKSTAKQGGK